MIIYTVLDKFKNTSFTKNFDSPYKAEKFRKRIDNSKRYNIVRIIYDIM